MNPQDLNTAIHLTLRYFMAGGFGFLAGVVMAQGYTLPGVCLLLMGVLVVLEFLLAFSKYAHEEFSEIVVEMDNPARYNLTERDVEITIEALKSVKGSNAGEARELEVKLAEALAAMKGHS